MRAMLMLFFIVVAALSAFEAANAQAKWHKTPYNPIPASRLNDGFFLNPTVGWVVNGVGQIHRTTDGGNSWLKQFENSSTHFRSIGFFDSLYGFAGCLGWGDPENPADLPINDAFTHVPEGAGTLGHDSLRPGH